MKSLKDYIYESSPKDHINEQTSIDSKKEIKKIDPAEPKDFNINFNDLENGEEIKEKLIELLQQNNISFDNNDKKITLNLSPNDKSKFAEALDLLENFIKKIRSSSKRSSDEQYAQKTYKFKKSVDKIISYFEQSGTEEE